MMLLRKDLLASISDIWKEIENGTLHEHSPEYRTYRRLGLNKEDGIRVSCAYPSKTLELLVEVGEYGEAVTISFPNWRGMGFDILILDVPKKGTQHIRLFLEDHRFRDIFSTICSDLVEGLDECQTNIDRRKELSSFLDRWSRFFERHGNDGISPERQRGLFGELLWIKRMIELGVAPSDAIQAWKGCYKEYHDFDLSGHVVEVKTTMSKEPRKVQISNERQLDESGLQDLHLYVLTLIRNDGVGESLPGLVASVKEILNGSAVAKFLYSLREAGYLDIHEALYTSRYTVKQEEFFQVLEGFPRIISMPLGTGDLNYSVVLATCTPFIAEIESYATKLIGSINHDK
jgi:hypothetical protein